MRAANTGSVVPATGIVAVLHKRSVTGRGMTVIAVAAGAVTAEGATATAVGSSSSSSVSGRRRCRQQVNMCETVPTESAIAGGADEV